MHHRNGPSTLLVLALIGTLSVTACAPADAGAPLATADESPAHLTSEHPQSGGADLQIKTVSSRNDMISGGDALVRIDVTSGSAEGVTLTLNGQDVSGAFKVLPGTSSLLGLVTGLNAGDNELAVGEARLTLTNWPVEGPIFSGPHQEPFVCMTEQFELDVTGGNLGPALDANCSVATRVDYIYRSTGDEFKPLADPSARPADLATTTVEGKQVPFIVRVETGTINRAIYQIAALHDPQSDGEVDPFTRPAGWNGRLYYTFGGGCPGGWYIQGSGTGGVLDAFALSHGFAVASSTLNVFGNNCDDVLSAETTMMVKERFIEQFGAPMHTIGWGSSGGSDQVNQISDNYPGLLDGGIVGSSFPDVPWAHMTTHSFGARLLYNYFQNATVEWTEDQQVAVAGFPSYETLVEQGTRADRINPRGVCNEAIPVELLYDATTNPRGARCTVYDHHIAALGRDPVTGFARRPLDNVAVQYGLKALNDGVISKEQFLELNEKVGGIDIDANFTAERTVADLVAVRNAYETGRFLSTGGGMAETALIDYRGYADATPGDPHMRYHSFSTRARLVQANGHSDNHVMVIEDRAAGGQSALWQEMFLKMDQWLLNVAQDTSNEPKAVKVVRAKPAGLVDGCISPSGERITETQLYQAGRCDEFYPAHASAYIVAGGPIANNIVVCQRKPIDPADYEVEFTAEEMARLNAVFPQGVCDYSKPGIEQRPLKGTWLSYGPAGVAPRTAAAN